MKNVMTRSVAVARRCVLPVICSVALAPLGAAAQEQEPAPNNGTDPTRLTTSAVVAYEYNDLNGGMERHSPRLDLTLPFGEKQDYSLRFRVPVASNDIAGDDSFGLGDVSVTGTHVFGLTRQRGLVAQAEMIFDTASRDELGVGKHVFKGTFIYAKVPAEGDLRTGARPQPGCGWRQPPARCQRHHHRPLLRAQARGPPHLHHARSRAESRLGE
ncbi:hypothetical protein MUU75_01840 [Pseudoxanthomonas mexicana]|uniref:hypothetical protein n=1 Tax=Pseudoxanthomonas mexicana TaxID=128785 RepID=UPI001FD63C0F|nr:hypothetical protein [Pseudoxanthomonas mexicana]UOV05498.1 hypothetical protein MUU75_01840 [Pseudoxanthomonas mexicana]